MKDTKALYWFLGKAAALYLIWHLIYYQIIEPDGRVNHYLTHLVARIAVVFLNLIGYETSVTPFSEQTTYVFLNNVPLVQIEDGCNGLILMVLFAGFIIAYPGLWKTKSWYIPLGIFIIYLINALRVVGLSINHIVSRSTFDFNHKYTFTIIIYGAIFGLWMLWANRFAKAGDIAAIKA
jgi:exosortase family protein XrtF